MYVAYVGLPKQIYISVSPYSGLALPELGGFSKKKKKKKKTL